MNALDDAKSMKPYTYESETLDAGYAAFCHECNQRVDEGHGPGCQWLAMPRIVAALEAAERLIEYPDEDIVLVDRKTWQSPDAASGHRYQWCGNDPGEGHADDCPWQALVAALKGNA